MGGKLMIGARVISSQLKQELSLPRVCEDSDLGLWHQGLIWTQVSVGTEVSRLSSHQRQ